MISVQPSGTAAYSIGTGGALGSGAYSVNGSAGVGGAVILIY
jgi:hypothetical protein